MSLSHDDLLGNGVGPQPLPNGSPESLSSQPEDACHKGNSDDASRETTSGAADLGGTQAESCVEQVGIEIFEAALQNLGGDAVKGSGTPSDVEPLDEEPEQTNFPRDELFEGEGGVDDEELQAYLLRLLNGGTPDTLLLPSGPHDGGIVDVWHRQRGQDWKYVVESKAWYTWCGTHWAKDIQLNLRRTLEELTARLHKNSRLAQAALKPFGNMFGAGKTKWYGQLAQATKRSSGRIDSVEKLAQARRAVAIDELDKGNLLNFPNGTLNLDEYQFYPHRRDDLLTYCASYEYDADAQCPRWEAFLEQVLVDAETGESDRELICLIQELFGYSLTNNTEFETMVWLEGNGANGKSVMLNVLRSLMDSLCVGVNFNALGMSGNYDLASLTGKRVVMSSEGQVGGKLSEDYIKRIASGEVLNARPIYGAPFEFKATTKIWWAMNAKPDILDNSYAMWRRMKLIPFNRTFTEAEQDRQLLAKLCEELPGILNWALVGLVRLRSQGRFTQAKAEAEARDNYRRESNPIRLWLEEETRPVVDSERHTRAKIAYEAYKSWCEATGNKPFSLRVFGEQLIRLGCNRKRTSGGNEYGFVLLKS